MFKTLSLLFVFLFLASCGKSGGGSSNKSAEVSTPAVVGDSVATEEVTVEAPVPPAAQNFEVNIKLDNFDSQQEDKVLTAADLIKKVIASEEFKNEILNYTYQGKKQFSDNGGLTNAEVYKSIIEGSEKLRPGADNEMDLDLEVFSRADNTVGYTYPSEIRVWMNARFLNRNTPAKVTTNMMHEWLHKLGFKHDYSRTAKRPFSVPYAVGYLVARLAAKMS